MLHTDASQRELEQPADPAETETRTFYLILFPHELEDKVVDVYDNQTADSTPVIQWTANGESDLAGYNIYRNGGSGWTRINQLLVTATTGQKPSEGTAPDARGTRRSWPLSSRPARGLA